MTGASGEGLMPAVPPLLPSRRSAILWSAGVLVIGALAAAALYAVNPAKHAVYPACPLYATTGWECPGCGGLRATHQLLHGRLAAAWALNPLAVLLVPLYAWFAVDAALTLARGRGLPKVAPRATLIWLGLAALVLFGILRNLL